MHHAVDTVDPPAEQARVLLVEDDPGDALLVQIALSEAGFPDTHVTWTRTFADALDAVALGPDCVLLDLGLPDAEGFGAVRKMVEAAPDVAVVVLTGRQEHHGVDALAAGAQDYLNKDALTGELLERSVRYAVERIRAQSAQQQLREYRLGADEQARLERGLLPHPRLLGDDFRCVTYYRPGRDDAVLGGDFYDVVEPEPGRLRAVIGDVMGHGADEAALGVHLRVAWRALVLAGVADAEILPLMSRLLDTEEGWYSRFATVCDVTITGRTMTLRVAGHPPPLLSSPAGAQYVEVQPGVPVGVTSARLVPQWRETSVAVPADASVVLYTDGLLDAFTDDTAPDSVGIDELEVAVDARARAGRPDAEWIAALLSNAPREPVDDTAVVVLTGPR